MTAQPNGSRGEWRTSSYSTNGGECVQVSTVRLVALDR